MRVSDRLALIDSISRELQSRFGFSDIDIFLAAYQIPHPQNFNVNSKRLYSATALKDTSPDKLINIAEELGLIIPRSTGISISEPNNWKNSKEFKIFTSHISKDRAIAKRLKDCLAIHSISGFVAHEDIHPTLEWLTEIERALYAMDAFVAIHTPGFSASVWTQQEIGFAVGRGTKIISLKMGEDPTGFISKQQALSRRNRTAEDIAEEIEKLLRLDPQTSKKLDNAQRAAAPMFDIGEDVPF
jgi:TIR domain